ncbi:hypothetical protein E2C01_000638 [Portunus trituberculatus]|uniref:Uncharacterized protein n=1 Tax=Portunus trituberculatus TaxID=210409 RepID=A0A5B7CHZ9_PORTR|nr:hypothetical protein [Portunus trituberculatus]
MVHRMCTHHSLHAVWEQHHQPSLPDPLGLSRGNELVNDALGCVVEVAKLSLPDDESIGIGHREAKLKAKHCILREGGVADSVRTSRTDMHTGSRLSMVNTQDHYFLVVQDVVPVREGSSLHILPRETHMDPFLQQ